MLPAGGPAVDESSDNDIRQRPTSRATYPEMGISLTCGNPT